jgi:hypothetical protein
MIYVFVVQLEGSEPRHEDFQLSCLALMMIGNDEAFAMKAGKRSGP